MTISFGFNIVTCDTGVITADNCHIMHSFITKVLVRQNYSFYLVSFSERRTGPELPGQWTWGPGLSLPTINTIEETEKQAPHTIQWAEDIKRIQLPMDAEMTWFFADINYSLSTLCGGIHNALVRVWECERLTPTQRWRPPLWSVTSFCHSQFCPGSSALKYCLWSRFLWRGRELGERVITGIHK